MKTILVSIPVSKCQRDKFEKAIKQYQSAWQLKFTYELSEQECKEMYGTAHVVVGQPDMELISDNQNLEWIQMTWAGTDKYTCNQGFPKHVQLTNASGAFGMIMSEYAIGAILSLYRRFPKYWQQQREHIWQDAGSEACLYGKTVLLLGTGDIGSNLAKRLEAFGTYNIGVRRESSKMVDGIHEMHDFEELDELLGRADIVACSLPNKPQTRGLLTKERMLRMKKDAVLLNMGRGSLIDTEDLVEVLEEEHLRGVILDVVNPEPLPKTHPLWDMERVMLTPHVAGPSIAHCEVTQDRIVDICCENIQHYLQGEPLRNRIGREEFEA
ncbi:MAG: D-2-hydroxyacid dehydrogenase [Lachnospiraceae bacterium]|nr:D-2-hydroxyacid dehydrogenase [Lachnospiraceae bacterium]